MGNPTKKHRLENETRSNKPKVMAKEEEVFPAMTSGEIKDVKVKHESPINLKGINVRSILNTNIKNY